MFKATNATLVAILILSVLVAGYLGYLLAPGQGNSVSFQAPAVTNDGVGAVAVFKVSTAPGTGKLLVNLQSSKFKQDTENSLLKAKHNAEKYMDVKLINVDITVDTVTRNEVVEGESAGAMFTTAIVAAYSGKTFKKNAIASAGINQDGTLFPVEGIEEKVLATRNAGKTIFVVAKNQEIRNEHNLPNDVQIIRVATANEAIDKLLE
ncbi:MAG: S16 family serine protease [Candidatus Woesearchaeota archaeon]|nr:S16 family serine protease [Candidatus Woesearchaeota archaeon]